MPSVSPVCRPIVAHIIIIIIIIISLIRTNSVFNCFLRDCNSVAFIQTHCKVQRISRLIELRFCVPLDTK